MSTRVRNYFSNISDRDVILILLGFFVGAVTVSLVSYSKSDPADLWFWTDSFCQNVGTEMFGAFLTFLLIEVLVSGRRSREALARAEHERLERLTRQLRSGSNDAAMQAIEELRTHQWFHDGSLNGADLSGANLQGLNLSGASLEDVTLNSANLQEATLAYTKLEGADLMGANFQGANFVAANLQGAQLAAANLRNADLNAAKLQGADLRDADLQGASLEATDFDQRTIMPDRSNWMPDTNLTHFTDPEHPNFWRSDNPYSPAYRDKEEDNSKNERAHQ